MYEQLLVSHAYFIRLWDLSGEELHFSFLLVFEILGSLGPHYRGSEERDKANTWASWEHPLRDVYCGFKILKLPKQYILIIKH